MGRPMRPVDPAAGPAAELAAGLRELRQQAGNPPFRQMARRAHYSATTLSVACSGVMLPSLDVTLAFVRACDGPQDAWRRRWTDAAALTGAGTRRPAVATRAAPAARRRAWRPAPIRGLPPWVGWSLGSFALALMVAGLVRAYWPARAAVAQPPAPSAFQAGLPPMYVGVTRCDPGSYRVLQRTLTLPRPVRLGGRAFPAGAVVGAVYLMYSPRCSEAWPHFSPVSAFFNQPGRLTLRSRSTPDGSVNTSPVYDVIRYADGEPMLTVLGCVDAEATIEFGADGPSVTAATACFQRA